MSHRLSGVPVNLLVAIFILFSIFIFTFTLVFATIVVPGYRLTTSFKVRPSPSSQITWLTSQGRIQHRQRNHRNSLQPLCQR
jgi:hypothetical protein